MRVCVYITESWDSLFSREKLSGKIENLKMLVYLMLWAQVHNAKCTFSRYINSMGKSDYTPHHQHHTTTTTTFTYPHTLVCLFLSILPCGLHFVWLCKFQGCFYALQADALSRSFVRQSRSYFCILLLSESATKKVFCSALAPAHTSAPWLTTVP